MCQSDTVTEEIWEDRLCMMSCKSGNLPDVGTGTLVPDHE